MAAMPTAAGQPVTADEELWRPVRAEAEARATVPSAFSRSGWVLLAGLPDVCAAIWVAWLAAVLHQGADDRPVAVSVTYGTTVCVAAGVGLSPWAGVVGRWFEPPWCDVVVE
jgi:hypothetical protein